MNILHFKSLYTGWTPWKCITEALDAEKSPVKKQHEGRICKTQDTLKGLQPCNINNRSLNYKQMLEGYRWGTILE